jgi:O-antigen/teichoic acid export membrane protein
VKRELDSYLRLTAPASAFLFGGIAAFGPRLDLIFGAGFVFDPVVCFLLPLGQVLSATLGPLGYSLSMTGRHRAENAILVAGGALLVIGCALLVPPFGARGAAAVVAAAFFFVNVWRFAVVRKMIGAWPGAWRDFAAAPIALTLACLCAAAASRWGARDLATTALACSIYTVAFAAAAFGLSSVEARRVVGAGLLSATQRLWRRAHEGRR